MFLIVFYEYFVAMSITLGQLYKNKRSRSGLPVDLVRKAQKSAVMKVRQGRGSRQSIPPALVSRIVKSANDTDYTDTAVASYAMDTTGSITHVNIIAQGTAVSQRLGKKLRLKSLQIRGYAVGNSAAQINKCCHLIVWDRRPVGSLPGINEIVTSVSSLSMNNDNNSGRYRILKRYDFMVLGNADAGVSGDITDCSAVLLDSYLDLKGLETVFDTTTGGAINSIESGALYAITMGNNAAGTSAATSSITYRCRYFENQ